MVCLGRERKGRALAVNDTVKLDQLEELFGCEFSDEALERVASTGKEIAVRYTLLYCTSQDCALLS
jgi:hypothetical protein